MGIYLGDTLFAGTIAGGNGGGGNGGGIVVNTLYTGTLNNGGAATLKDSYKNYDFLVAIAGVSGSKSYQYSGFFAVADIPESGTRQLYLATPFELNADNSMKNYCGMVVDIKSDTSIGAISKFSGWSSGALYRLIGIKIG